MRLQIAVDVADSVVVLGRIRLKNFKNHVFIALPITGKNGFFLLIYVKIKYRLFIGQMMYLYIQVSMYLKSVLLFRRKIS